MRVVVVEPPPPRDRIRAIRDPLAVGAFDFRDPDPVATVVVKLTYSFAGDTPAIAPAQAPLAYPLDFVPYKPAADVIVVGHAHASGGPMQEIPIRVAIGAIDRSVLAMASAPAVKIPLEGGALFTPDAEEQATIGPLPIPADPMARTLDPDFDYTVFHAAPPEQRREPFELGETLRLTGLSPRGERSFDLPREAPRVLVSFRGTTPDAELAMVADTLWIDTDAETFAIVYRGMIATPRVKSVARIAVSIEREGEVRPWPMILRSAARGTFAMSVGSMDDSAAPRDEDERDRITLARADLTLGEVPPEPLLALDAYVAIGAELAEKREPRADVLARHGFDEVGFAVEERAWLEAMADRAAHGDGSLAAEVGEKFVAAQDALADPSEARRTHADWAEITAAIETADDIPKELGRRDLSLAAWMRLDRRVQRDADADEAVADEIARLLGEARERAEMRADGGDEPEPVTARPAAIGNGGGER